MHTKIDQEIEKSDKLSSKNQFTKSCSTLTQQIDSQLSVTLHDCQACPISMQQFCTKFYQDHYQQVNIQLTIKQLTIDYNVKNRRVYDLLGILEGFNFVIKTKKKGTYIWIGMEHTTCQYNFQQNKPVSLKDVAGLLKLLFKNHRSGLTIKQLNDKVIHRIEEKTKKLQSKITITRRIYECLKVMKIFGMIEKNYNIFRLTLTKLKKPILFSQNRQIQSQNIIMQNQKNVQKRVEKYIISSKTQNIIVSFNSCQ